MSIRKIILLNTLLVASVGVFGFLTDEPYWRSVGHAPELYDYFFWLALALNGPSGFTADYAAWHIIDNVHITSQALIQAKLELRFALQYALWLLLLWPQWQAYDLLVRWCGSRPYRKAALCLAALGITLAGGVWAYQSWTPNHRIGLVFIDRFFWVVRAIGLGLSGVVILLYGYLVQTDSSRIQRT